MRNKINIAFVTCEDAADVLAYLHQVFDESHNLTKSSDEFTPTIEEEQAFIQSILDHPRKAMWKATIQDEIVALCNLDTNDLRRLSHRCGFGISVKKAYWGNHIASTLLEEAIAFAKAHEFSDMDLEVVEDNEAAIHLYESYGFVKCGYHPRFFRIQDTYLGGYTMNLDLSKK